MKIEEIKEPIKALILTCIYFKIDLMVNKVNPNSFSHITN